MRRASIECRLTPTSICTPEDALLATLGLGGSGRLHYWDGSFHDTAVAWSPNAWYLVTATFDTVQHRFDFTVYDEALAQVVKVSSITFAARRPA